MRMLLFIVQPQWLEIHSSGSFPTSLLERDYALNKVINVSRDL